MRFYLIDNTNTENEVDSVLSGENLHWRADDTLDSATIIFVSNDATPIKPLTITRLKFEYGNGTFISGSTNDLLVASDSVENYSKRDGSYKHTLSLVELTKILEKLFVNSLVLTGKTTNGYTLYSQLLKAKRNINVQIDKYNEIIFDNSPIQTKTSAYMSEDFNFQNATVREIFDEMFSACDCRVEVKEVGYLSSGARFIKVGFLDNNALTERTLTSADKVGSFSNNNCDNYNGKIVSVTSNATPQNLMRQTDNFKATATTATTNNRVIQFTFPPEYLTKFDTIGKSGKTINTYCWDSQMQSQVVSINIGGQSVPLIQSYNGANYVDIMVDKEYWDTLDDEPDNSNPDRNEWPYCYNQYKHNTLYYERGSETADISQTYKTVWTSQQHFANAMIKAYHRYLILHPELVPSGYTLNKVTEGNWPFNDYYYDTIYAPLIDTMVEVSKDYDDCDKGLCVIDGQSANTLDLTRYGRNLLGKTQRIGNDEYIKDYTCDSYGDILEPLDYIVENGKRLVVYQTDIQVMTKPNPADDEDKNWYKVRLYLANNYNNLSERVALAREKRIYEIPLTGYKTIIPLREQVTYGVHSHYGIPGITAGEEDSAYKINAFIGQTLTEKTVYGTQTQLTPIENMICSTHWNFASLDIGNFCLPVCGFGCGNTMNFIAKFYDNYSAGLSVTDNHSVLSWIGGQKVVYNRYTNTEGELDLITNISLANSNNTGGNIAQRPKQGTSETFKTFSLDDDLYFDKDRAESLQLQKIYKFKPTGGAWISPLCLEDNNAFFNSGRTLYVYRNCTFKQGQTIRTDGTSLGRAGSVLTCVVGHGTGSESDKYFAYVYVTNGNYYNNLIICDENNRIYAYIPRLSDNYKFIIK